MAKRSVPRVGWDANRTSPCSWRARLFSNINPSVFRGGDGRLIERRSKRLLGLGARRTRGSGRRVRQRAREQVVGA